MDEDVIHNGISIDCVTSIVKNQNGEILSDTNDVQDGMSANAWKKDNERNPVAQVIEYSNDGRCGK